MKAYARLIVLAGGVTFVSACGFSPIYGTREGAENAPAVAEALGAIQIENIPEANGQFLRNKLIDRLYFKGRPATPKAFLRVQIHATEIALGIQKDATSSRSQIDLSAAYTLVDADKKPLLSGAAHAVASYGKLSAQYGTLATQRSAYERALGEISEQIVGRLSLHYAEKEK